MSFDVSGKRIAFKCRQWRMGIGMTIGIIMGAAKDSEAKKMEEH